MNILFLVNIYNEKEKEIIRTIKSVLCQRDIENESIYLVLKLDQDRDINFDNLDVPKNIKLIIEKSSFDDGLTISINMMLKKYNFCSVFFRQDAGDLSLPYRIRNSLDLLESIDVDFISFASEIRNERKDFLFKKSPFTSRLLSKLDFVDSNKLVHGSLCGKMSAFIKIGFYRDDVKYAQDYYLYYDILSNGLKIYFSDKPVYAYVISSSSISTNKAVEQKQLSNFIKNRFREDCNLVQLVKLNSKFLSWKRGLESNAINKKFLVVIAEIKSIKTFSEFIIFFRALLILILPSRMLFILFR